MIPTLEAELLSALYALFFGILLGLFYDAVRVVHILLGIRGGGALGRFVSRIRFPYLNLSGAVGTPRRVARAVLLFLCDASYALLSGIGFCVWLYAYHDGVFRLFLLCAVIVGMVAYFFTLGRLVLSVSGTVAYLVRVLLSYLFLCVRTPILFALRLFLFALRLFLFALLSLLARLLSPLATEWALSASQRHARAFFSGVTNPT